MYFSSCEAHLNAHRYMQVHLELQLLSLEMEWIYSNPEHLF